MHLIKKFTSIIVISIFHYLSHIFLNSVLSTLLLLFLALRLPHFVARGRNFPLYLYFYHLQVSPFSLFSNLRSCILIPECWHFYFALPWGCFRLLEYAIFIFIVILSHFFHYSHWSRFPWLIYPFLNLQQFPHVNLLYGSYHILSPSVLCNMIPFRHYPQFFFPLLSYFSSLHLKFPSCSTLLQFLALRLPQFLANAPFLSLRRGSETYHKVSSGRELAGNGLPCGQVVTDANNGAPVPRQELLCDSFRFCRRQKALLIILLLYCFGCVRQRN